jgi:hypothetical protein
VCSCSLCVLLVFALRLRGLSIFTRVPSRTSAGLPVRPLPIFFTLGTPARCSEVPLLLLLLLLLLPPPLLLRPHAAAAGDAHAPCPLPCALPSLSLNGSAAPRRVCVARRAPAAAIAFVAHGSTTSRTKARV